MLKMYPLYSTIFQKYHQAKYVIKRCMIRQTFIYALGVLIALGLSFTPATAKISR